MRVPVAALFGAIGPIVAGCSYSQYPSSQYPSQYPYQYPAQYSLQSSPQSARAALAGRSPNAAPAANTVTPTSNPAPSPVSNVTPVSNPAPSPASNAVPASNATPATNAAPANAAPATPADNATPASHATPVSMTPPAVRRFTGIPMPPSNTIDLDRTIVLGGESEWLGRIVFTTPATVDDIVEFYRREMPRYGWAEFSATRATTTVLAYQADARVATIQVIGQASGEGQAQSAPATRIEFWIVPRATITPVVQAASVVPKAEAQQADAGAPPIKLNLVRGDDNMPAAPPAAMPPPPPPRPPVDQAPLRR